MKLNHGLHLAYCTNVHRGETWAETFDSLERYTLAVREQVCPDELYGIGLRLSDQASRELLQTDCLREFKHWLEEHGCYVFTINGFPFGRFHGGRIKEKVYSPDWTSSARLDYTRRLFDILAQLVPKGIEGSVSTLPGSFKDFIVNPEQVRTIRENIWHCVEHVARVSQETGRKMHLGLEPEPLGLFETTAETIAFFEQLRSEHSTEHAMISEYLGVNYDTCHLAVEFEEPAAALQAFQKNGIRISKFHLSSALKVKPTLETRAELAAFAEDTYLHQVVARSATGGLRRYVDLDVALKAPPASDPQLEEWRIHFHIPLHSPATPLFDNTTDHLAGVLDMLAANPSICSHLEMETYTWEVLPAELKNRTVVEQLVAEYDWTLQRLDERGLTRRV